MKQRDILFLLVAEKILSLGFLSRFFLQVFFPLATPSRLLSLLGMGSNYLLDVLVLVPLPFLFLFPSLLLVWQSLQPQGLVIYLMIQPRPGSPSPLSLVFFVFFGFPFFFSVVFRGLCALFESSGFRRFAAFRLRQVLYAPPSCHSPIATFFSDVPAKSRLSLLWLIVLLFVLCFLLFSYILFHLFYFVLIFLCILFLLGFHVLLLSVCFVCFLVFTVLPMFSAPILPLSIHCPHCAPLRRASNASFSVSDLLV